MINGSSVFQTVKKGRLSIFKPSLYHIHKAIEGKDLKERHLREIVPEQYHECHPLFGKVFADRFPAHRLGIDHNVRLRDGDTPTWRGLYSMSRTELVILKEWLKENISKLFIRQSSLPFSAPVPCAKKPNGGLLFSIDY